MKLSIYFILVASFVNYSCSEDKFAGRNGKLPSYGTQQYTQDGYAISEETFNQGFSGDRGSETFEQGEFGKLDILVVVDNSGSMAEEQRNLAEKLQPLLSRVESADWRIAIMPTSKPGSRYANSDQMPCHRAIIDKGDLIATAEFRNAVNVGTDGYGVEKGILRAVEGLGRGCALTPWLRENSTVAVLIVTDEDNCSLDSTTPYDQSCKSAPYGNANYLLNHLQSIRNPGVDAKVYGLIWKSGTMCNDQYGKQIGGSMGRDYEFAIQATGGSAGSICDGDYTNTLTDISEDVRQILKYEFDMDRDPDDGKVEVLVNGQNWDRYTMEGRKIKFSEPPPFGSKVEIRYTHGRNGSIVDTFALKEKVVTDSVKVQVNGEDSSDFTVSDNSLKFYTPPTEKATISVKYKILSQLKNRFPFEVGRKLSEVSAKVNDQTVSGVHYLPESGEFEFDTAPAELTKIEVRYRIND